MRGNISGATLSLRIVTNARESSWRLLPSEHVLWSGRPARVSHSPWFRLGAALLLGLAMVSALFAGLLYVNELAGARQTAAASIYLALTAVAVWLLPSFWIDAQEYLITDKRVLTRRGRLRRSMERRAITFGRIEWHRDAPGVGTLTLVRAVPFGPLMRQQSLVLHNIATPDAVLATMRGADVPKFAGDRDVPLASRLEEGEVLLWGGAPESSLRPSWRENATALLGLLLAGFALYYAQHVARILVGLEEVGLPVVTMTWWLFFSATLLSFGIIAGVAVLLLWSGIVRSRALLRDTEYLLTDRRVIVRRGATELFVDRKRVVDVVVEQRSSGCAHLFLVLDGPLGRMLNDNGALSAKIPARDLVPPILFEVRDAERVRGMILDAESRVSLPSVPPFRDAA